MRLYKQELKRLFLSARVKVIFLSAIVLSLLLALLPSEFSDANVPDEQGNIHPLHGVEAIKYIEEISSSGNGEVTPDRLKEALQTYQDLYYEYGVDPLESSDFPLDVYWEQIRPIRPLLRMIAIAYGTNMKDADLMSLHPDDMDRFYEACELRLVNVMESDYILKDADFIRKATTIYDNVKKPFIVSQGYTRDAFDYISLTIFMLVLLSSVMAAPVFSERYASGEDSVIRCTEFGRGKIVRTTLMAVFTISSLMYFMGIGIHLLVSDMIFGTDTLRESVQDLYTVYSLPALNLFELQIILALTGWLCCITVTFMATCISAFTQEASTAMVLSIIMVFLPIIIFAGIGTVSWILAMFPAASEGLNNNMLYSLLDLRFLRMGGNVFWYPMVLVIANLIEIPLFGIISNYAYSRHQVR